MIPPVVSATPDNHSHEYVFFHLLTLTPAYLTDDQDILLFMQRIIRPQSSTTQNPEGVPYKENHALEVKRSFNAFYKGANGQRLMERSSQ